MKEDIPELSDERVIIPKYLADQVALSVILMNYTFLYLAACKIEFGG
jgi:hypothetical protein